MPPIGLGDHCHHWCPRLEQCVHLRVLRSTQPSTAGGAKGHQRGVGQFQLTGHGAGEELGVLGHRPWPATLDETDTKRVHQPGDGELVGHRVGNPLALGTVAQRGVVEVEVVTERGAGWAGAGHRRGSKRGAGNKKDPSRVREVCASGDEACYPTRSAIMITLWCATSAVSHTSRPSGTRTPLPGFACCLAEASVIAVLVIVEREPRQRKAHCALSIR